MLNKILSLLGVDPGTSDFDIIISCFHEGLLITDPAGVILYYNSAMAEVDDLEPDYVIGKTIVEVYDLTEKQSMTMRCLASGKAVVNESIYYRTYLGKITNALVNAYPLYSEKRLVGALCVVNEYNITETKIANANLLRKPATTTDKPNGTRFTFADIIGRRTDLAESVRIAQMAAQSPSPVLIAGDTGTGKELFAQAIHNAGINSTNPFVPINCAAIPENLLEGILFGTSRGAFTGAIDKAGLFEQANGGTLFLDELNSMPMTLQAKLLRVIQEKKVRRVGSNQEIGLNLKIISSVNKDPHEEINSGKLRLDLFYRLGVVFLQIPSLQNRKNDLKKLIYHFMDKFNSQLKKQVEEISAEVEDLFLEYHWPGNVRELEHVIEAAMNLVTKEIRIERHHLPQHFIRSIARMKASRSEGLDMDSYGASLSSPAHDTITSLLPEDELRAEQVSLDRLNQAYETAERKIIQQALVNSKGNIAKAVRLLGVSSPQALQYRMKKLMIKRSDFISIKASSKKILDHSQSS